MKTFFTILIFFVIHSSILAKDLTIAVGLSIPPYVIKENNSGFEIELIRDVLQRQGYGIKKIIYASNKRIKKLLEEKKVDMALNLQPYLKNIFYSDVIVEFFNVAITLKSRHIDIKSMFDLHYKRVYAFQNARFFLGDEFAEFARSNALYSETTHQLSQVRHLLEKRVDVVIADKYIFLYYMNNNKSRFDKNTQLNFFDILPKSPRYAGFTDLKLQQEFNQALKEFKKTKKYQGLYSKYNLLHTPMDKQ